MMWPRGMTYATAFSPFFVTTLLSCYYCNILSGIVLEIACPKALHRFGCFDNHINIYLTGCALFTSTRTSHSVLLCEGNE